MRTFILDYGAGNVRSLVNSIESLGVNVEWVKTPEDIAKADKLIFPGVGSFGQALQSLTAKGYTEPLRQYIQSGKEYFGICIGMQALFVSSEESAGVPGLGVIDALVQKFKSEPEFPVPHIGWNSLVSSRPSEKAQSEEDFYFVHSYKVPQSDQIADWIYTTTTYGNDTFVSSVRRGNVYATQFHPEKSSAAGLKVLEDWLKAPLADLKPFSLPTANPNEKRTSSKSSHNKNTFKKRIIACLDVRANDAGDLVVTKGDQYDVRDSSLTTDGPSEVRNLGKPVALAKRYYEEGADEICLLNITSFRSCPLSDQPMLDVVKRAAETIFVPLTIGGGIKDTTDPDGTVQTALQVAGAYFRAGADKVSIGSDAVYAVEKMLATGECDGSSGIESISSAYGSQAVVVSIDPRRNYDPTSFTGHERSIIEGQNAKGSVTELERTKSWWYQCTVSGGRESRDLDVVQLAQGVEKLGAGEILLNSVDRDGSGRGFDLDLVRLVRNAVTIPVVASSGAGTTQHFVDLFQETNVEAALAAGIFHRKEISIREVKTALKGNAVACRTGSI